MTSNVIDTYKILLVDDNEFEIKSFESFFREYNLTTCIDPEVAYEKITHEPFNIIFLDIHMKKMNGLKLYKHIKQSSFNKDAYTIAYTGITDEAVQDVINDVGFNEIIEKPASLSLIAEKINNIIKLDVENNFFNRKTIVDFVEVKEDFSFELNGIDLKLTYKEYEILKILLTKRGEIVNHTDMYLQLYGKEERSGNIIKSHIKNLRNKLSKVVADKHYIKTAPLKGYCLI